MSDDLKDVAFGESQRSVEVAEEPDLAEALSQLELRQAVMERHVGNLETSLVGLLQALFENRKKLEALAQAAKGLQGAEARIERAETRLQRSVDTNIGRQRTIQKLRKRVAELEKALKQHLPIDLEHPPVERN